MVYLLLLLWFLIVQKRNSPTRWTIKCLYLTLKLISIFSLIYKNLEAIHLSVCVESQIKITITSLIQILSNCNKHTTHHCISWGVCTCIYIYVGVWCVFYVYVIYTAVTICLEGLWCLFLGPTQADDDHHYHNDEYDDDKNNINTNSHF